MPALWVELLDGLSYEVSRPLAEQTSDMGEMTWRVLAGLIPGGDIRAEPSDVLRRELADRPAVGWADDDENEYGWLCGLVTEVLGPELWRRRLLRARPYPPTPPRPSDRPC